MAVPIGPVSSEPVTGLKHYQRRGIAFALSRPNGRTRTTLPRRTSAGTPMDRKTLSRSSIMSKRVRCVSIQFFEEPHRATAVLVDLARLELVNKSWLLRNPQVQRYPVMMSKLEDVLLCARTKNDSAGSLDFAAILNKLTSIMTKAVSTSSLHHHSIANLRLHGNSSFGQRFEVLHVLYNSII